MAARRNSWIPGAKYLEIKDWAKTYKGANGKFGVKPRKTFTEEVMESEKGKPAPTKYDNKEALKRQIKVIGNYNS